MISLHPNILEQEGKKQFVVLPYHEFISLQQELADYEDLRDLRKAKNEEKNAPTVSLEKARNELGL